jgi:uncharacterized protein (TIGR00299 family) protein
MKIAWIEPFGGIAGDMMLAALFDAGCDVDDVISALRTMQVPDFELRVHEATRGSLRCLLLSVEGEDEASHRHLSDILEMIDASALSSRAKERAKAIFQALGEAEARAHGESVEKVHFHEVGALDSIVDIVGVAVATDLLDLDEFYSSTLPLPRGTIEAAHGTLPLPAPATMFLMEGMPTRPQPYEGESVTPTGAAILRGLGCRFDPPPAMRIERVGIGGGTRDTETANVLRIAVGASKDAESADGMRLEPISVVEATIDDMNPEWYEFLDERLREAGAVDVFLQSVMMKRTRPGTLVTALCPPEQASTLCEVLLTHSTTIGARFRTEMRYCLPRSERVVETEFGEIRVKEVVLPSGERRWSPEYSSLSSAARAHGVSLKVIEAALSRALGEG